MYIVTSGDLIFLIIRLYDDIYKKWPTSGWQDLVKCSRYCVTRGIVSITNSASILHHAWFQDSIATHRLKQTTPQSTSISINSLILKFSTGIWAGIIAYGAYQTLAVDTGIHFIRVTLGSIDHFTSLFCVEVETISNTVQGTGFVMSWSKKHWL